MATRAEIGAVYAGGVVQGVALVTFPAVSAIFTNPADYALSNSAYGGIFVPQAIAAIVASLLGAGLTRRLGGKRILLLGLGADLISMLLLFASQFVMAQHALAYGLLLAATGFLGVGFGFVVPALNTFTAAFFPAKIDQAVLTLNALLGLGTALAPIFAALFVGLGFWWGLPVLMVVLTLALIFFTMGLGLSDAGATPASGRVASTSRFAIPARFWLYAAFALIYGACETLNGNWASVYLLHDMSASTTQASLALTCFWVAVTGGRVLFAAIEKWCPERLTFRALPVIIALAFAATAWTPADQPIVGILTFGLAGLGCSALLPLVISFAQGELVSMQAVIAGALIGCYQMGYGLAAFGVGPLQGWTGATLSGIYREGIAAAIALAVLAALIAGRKTPSPA